MAFNNYCAIQSINRPELAKRWANARTNIPALEVYINNIIDPLRGPDDSIVVIPRFSAGYISLRLCGLEVFRISPNGQILVMLKKTGVKVVKLKKPEISVSTVAELPAEVASLLRELCVYVQNYRMGPKDGNTRKLIRIQPEHWLESIIIADNQLGLKLRAHLRLNAQLSKCVTQAPANPVSEEDDGRYIDILSVLEDGRVKLVELKIDDDVIKANEELTSYKQWLSGREYDAKFYPDKRWEEGYLPTRIEGVAGGGWREPFTPDCLVVATSRSEEYPTILLRDNFINHILEPFSS